MSAISKVMLLVVLAACYMLMGCSGSEGDLVTPVIPDGLSGSTHPESPRVLWGMWNLYFNPADMTVTTDPVRHPQLHFNITDAIRPPACDDCLEITVISFDPVTRILDAEVTLRNPYLISGRDVRGILYMLDAGHNLLNADDWTGLWDIPTGTDINPFRAFARDEPNRTFGGEAEHSEQFMVYIPTPPQYAAIQFAVDASWPGNCSEPYSIHGFEQDFLIKDIDANAEVWVSVYDWQDDVDSVSLRCPEITGEDLVYFTSIGQSTYSLDLVNAEGASDGEYEAEIIAQSGENTLHDFVTITVLEKARTIGLIQRSPHSCDGYTLFAPIGVTTTYLIDIEGRQVHSWDGDFRPGIVVYFLENGNLLRTYHTIENHPGGVGGAIQEQEWDGSVVWEFSFPDLTVVPHHDIERLPNGNTLIIAWVKKTEQEALDAGRDPAFLTSDGLWPDAIFEIDPEGDIVWKWSAWDHMCSELGGVANGNPLSTDIDDPTKVNINFTQSENKDWLHTNAVDYNPELDQIVISPRQFNELWVIDHSTADYFDPGAGITAAAGPAGDLLYRWGNPRAYGAGTEDDQKFFGQHDTQWIEPGYVGEDNFLVFNNGSGMTPTQYSTVDEIAPPYEPGGAYTMPSPGSPFEPAEQVWKYIADPPTSFSSGSISGASRLQNGNTLVCSGTIGWFFEVNQDDEIVWQYINPVSKDGPQHQGTDIEKNRVFRCYRYGPDYPGFTGKDLTPGDPIELPWE